MTIAPPIPPSPVASRAESPRHTGRGTFIGLLSSLRPHQWIKNTLVFGGVIFSQSLGDLLALQHSVMAFVAFCLASSGIYLLNDLRDIRQDRQHPSKRFRPLAAGQLSTTAATMMMIGLLGGGIALSAAMRGQFLAVLIAYVLLNVAYSFGLKHVALLDVMLIAMGFVLRAVGGAAAIGVGASPWLILCTLMLALLVGFGKRRHELGLLEENARRHRASLDGYSLPLLDLLMGISAGASVVMYALYTLADETVARFGSANLILTIPFVLYGVFRYLYLVVQARRGGDPARLFVSDLPTLVNGLLWVGVVCYLIYAPTAWLPW
jgi:4-hydroxybenzoate polyprenyltransferase